MHMAEKNARGRQDKILSEASQEKTRTSGRGKRVQDLLAERSCCRDMGDKERGKVSVGRPIGQSVGGSVCRTAM